MSESLRIAVLGATGRTGARVVASALRDERFTLVAAVGAHPGQDAGRAAGEAECGVIVGALGPGCFADAEVVVDFSTPNALDRALTLLGGARLVTGTTGLLPDQVNRLVDRSIEVAVLTAPNFSTGVTLLADLVERAARALPDYDVEIVEAHHRGKVDAPSGTAIALARAAARGHDTDLEGHAIYGREGRTGARPAGAIGLHAVRMGDVVGEHTVWLAGLGERLQLGHVATSRDTFAAGALRAAAWLQDRPPGRYSMRHVLGLDP